MDKNSRLNEEYPIWQDADDRPRRKQPPAKRVDNLWQNAYQWVVILRKHILGTRGGRIIAPLLAASMLIATLGPVGLAYAQYSHIKSEATVALAHLKAAETDLKTLESNPFDTTAIDRAHNELGQANAAFVQMNNAIQAIPGVLVLTPIVGSKLDAAFKIGPIAVEATQVGMLGCDILKVLAPKLKNPLATDIPGVTSADISTIDAKFSALYSLASTLLQQVQEVPPSASSLDPRLGSLLALVSTHLPELAQGLQDARNLIDVLPQLLGVGNPANYLLEVMDSTEIRPGGGFIGNLGDLTLSGGRMEGKPQIKDVDLLDRHFKGIVLPSQFSWFTPGGSNLGFRDSNLDADFPSNAQRALQEYNYEGGSALLSNEAGPITQFQGVIAITPWLIENMLQITGSVYVQDSTGATVQINPTNLIDDIHYNQLAFGQGGPDDQVDPNPVCQGTSYRKCFTVTIFTALMSKLGEVSAKNFGALGTLLKSSIQTKDIQIYLTEPGAEALLRHHDLASTLNAPTSGDSLTVVDANVGGVKANNQIAYTWNDQVSLDSLGNATHDLVLTYDWPSTGYNYQNAYPCHGCTYLYQDYLRIYIPDGSIHISLPDTLARWHSPLLSHGFGMTVIQGLIYFSIGDPTFTVSLSWTVPHAAIPTAGGWLYQYAVEKQAGINTRPLDVALTLPSCAHVYGTLQGFTRTSTAHRAVYHRPSLTSDVTLGLSYTC